MNAGVTFFERLSTIQDLVRSLTDPRAALAGMAELLQDSDLRRQFFLMLDTPDWIDPLIEIGLFATVPPAVKVEGGGVRYPPWPQSQYLARIAQMAPEKVANVFSRLHTDNGSVIRDILDAALRMPAPVAARLVPRVCAAHESRVLFAEFTDPAELCARLAREGEPDAAMTLARCLFAVTSERDLDQPNRRDDHWYFEGLHKVIPAVVATRTEGFLKLLLEGLRVVAESKSHGDSDPEYDASPWWRPAIEEHEQNSDYDFASRYVGCVREALEIAIRDGHIALGDALHLLTSYARLVYKRLRLHLISTFADRDPALGSQTMMNRALFDNYRYKHEYAMLCRQRFPLLSDEDRAVWLGWMDAGPDMSDFDASVRKNLGREPTEEDRRNRIEYWHFEKLHWIRDHLDGDRLKYYQHMLSKHGTPELADLNVRHSAGFRGHESPFTLGELVGKDFREVIDQITTWRPDKPSHLGPSPEGAAAVFKQYLEEDAAKYAEQAGLLKHRPAIYVRTYLEAMKDAVARSPSVNLRGIIDLCKWVLGQPVHEDASVSQEPDPFEDKNWQWTRDSISEFARSACKAGVSLDYRQDLWELVVPLTSDSAESSIVESPDTDPRLKDYATLSLNSPCGKAMHGVFAYARWIADSVAKNVNGRQVVEGGLDHMPEVRALLEARLAPGDPGGFMLRATYGWFWSLMYWIDPEWLERRAARICDLQTIDEGGEKAFGWAAWNTFLMGTQPHIQHYQLLRPQFSYAVDQAATISPEDGARDGPFENLAEHLMILYGRGQLTLESDDAIVQRLLKDSVPPVRKHAIQFVGVSLRRGEATQLPDAVVHRFVALWDWYWQAVGQVDARSGPRAGSFGYWFVSGVFDPSWAIERLEQFVRLVLKPEPHSQIVEKLAEIANFDLVRSVRIVGCLVDGDDEDWRISSWRDHAKKILASAMAAESEARHEAIRVIDRLGRRGFVDFGELLHI